MDDDIDKVVGCIDKLENLIQYIIYRDNDKKKEEMNKIKKLKKYCKNNKPEKIFKHYKDGGEINS